MRIQSVLRCAVSIVIVVVGAQYPSPAQGLDIDRVTSLTVGLPAVLPLPLYTAVAASSDFGFPCALQVNGRITCWGAWWTLPGYRVPEGRFIQVSTGGGVGCGLEPAGRVTCWGSSQFATTHVPEGIYRQVSVGDTFVCGLRETGSIICWGMLVCMQPKHQKERSPKSALAWAALVA